MAEGGREPLQNQRRRARAAESKSRIEFANYGEDPLWSQF